uniref:Reticulocalbin-3 n=1 Tax=Diabrotica virgifera virgifera TaxID=50390 RepID=A0A6P7F674_DIAVI
MFRVLFYLFLIFANTINAGVMHSHTNEIHKERESDGAYSPRNHGHFSEEGEHYNEFDHEAILGSHKEAEMYDQLPPEEAKRRLAILLKKMDLNNDSQIERHELKAWIIRSFSMLSEEEAKDRLEEPDENNDGQVTWEEYLADTYGLDSSENNIDIGGENEHLIESDRAMWKAADVNGDGILDENEWAPFSHPEEYPSMLPLILEQTLKEKDTDGDNGLIFQEFVGERGTHMSKEDLLTEKSKFDAFDSNGDGKLTGNEILSWVVPSNDEIADEEVDHLFASSDDTHDGVLSFSEILAHHDIFVGSEATDYGDHLHNIHHFDDEL